MHRLRAILIALAAALAFPGVASASPFPTVIALPGATSAEGIAAGPGTTFFAGDLVRGDIYRGDLRAGTASPFIDAPDGRMAVGMKVDAAHGILIVAGGFTGQAYAYDLGTGTERGVVQLADPTIGTIINDVAVLNGVAWFTDSLQPQLYRVPIAPDGSFGQPSTLTLNGPAATLSGFFNLNGIAATHDGGRLIVSHSGEGRLYTVDPSTGDSAVIAGPICP